MGNISELLEGRGVKVTSNRLLVARVLASSNSPMSLAEIEAELESVDKSGIFRVLKVFSDKHLIHAFTGSDGIMRYELCHSGHLDVDDDRHVHFCCEVCGRTICLEGVPVPQINLPDGYDVHEAGYILKGICPDCNR